MKRTRNPFKFYRGFLIKWEGPSDAGHWLIYDNNYIFCGSADASELDAMLDEMKGE